jgi:hypothetical protein
MKLIRLATIYFDPLLDDWRSWSLTFGPVEVQTMGSWELEGKLRLLVFAQVDLPQQLELTTNGLVIIPEEPRKLAEQAIEAAANIISVFEQCKRSIASPDPYVALLPEDSESQAWLNNNAKGISCISRSLQDFRFRIKLDKNIIDSLKDRLDGVALLAESLSHDHATGKYHEFLRLFERAFGCSSSNLVEPLAQFLTGRERSGYTTEEVQGWVVDLRHPATHADRRPCFVLESDIRPVIQRVKQAAYDVLFNKAKWRDSSSERRKLWIPLAGTSSKSHDLFIVKGTAGIRLEAQLLDGFYSYPLDLSAGINALPKGWWTKPTLETEV